ncbi:MAG: hypothetical protein HN348_16640, partial [Proteobacteria bacterium]|nr:hypothetical protein [Pseudomonadota bacterium]
TNSFVHAREVSWGKEGFKATLDVFQNIEGHGHIRKYEPKTQWAGVTLNCKGGNWELPAQEFLTGEEHTVSFAWDGVGESGKKECSGFVAATWGKKHDSCAEDTHGCRVYGYVLEDLLRAFPRFAFSQPNLPWSVFPRDNNYEIQLLDAGGGPDGVAEMRSLLEEINWDDLVIYSGTKVRISDGGKAGNPREVFGEILYRSEDNIQVPIYEKVRDAGQAVKTRGWPDAPANIVIAVGPMK